MWDEANHSSPLCDEEGGVMIYTSNVQTVVSVVSTGLPVLRNHYTSFLFRNSISRMNYSQHKVCFMFSNLNKPAPSLATSSRSADVVAEEMASGSFRVKGNTSLRKGQQLGQQVIPKRVSSLELFYQLTEASVKKNHVTKAGSST